MPYGYGVALGDNNIFRKYLAVVSDRTDYTVDYHEIN